MSILSSFYHREIHDNPNATHNIRSGQTQDTARMDAESAAMCPPVAHQPGESTAPIEQNLQRRQLNCENSHHRKMMHSQAKQAAAGLNCVSGSRAAWQAELEGSLRPDLYYSQQTAVPGHQGWEESPHTVADKVEQREEFPRG